MMYAQIRRLEDWLAEHVISKVWLSYPNIPVALVLIAEMVFFSNTLSVSLQYTV